MSLTLAKVYNQLELNLIGNQGVKEALYTATFDSSYPTEGELFDPTSTTYVATPFTTVYAVTCHFRGTDTPTTTGYVAIWDSFNSKIQVFWSHATGGGAMMEVSNTTDLSALVFDVFIKGI